MNQAFIPLSVPNFAGNERQYVTDAVVSEWVSTGGSMVGAFEEAFARYVGMPRAVACASGTAGLHLALLLAGIGQNDEVIAPALTFIAAVNPIRYVGAQPVFIGCDESLCISPAAVEAFCQTRCEARGGVLYNRASGRAVKGLMVVHVFGNMAAMPALCALARKYGLVLIEDATEAVGTVYTGGPFKGKMAGSMGDVGVYSFNGNKIMTTGAGGMLVTPRADWAARAKHLSTQAKADETHYLHDEVGYNYRMTNLQAALGLAQLEQIEAFVARKNAMYARYHQSLHGKRGLRLLPFRKGVRSNRWFYSLHLGSAYPIGRDALIKYLADKAIQSRPIWGLINEQAPYAPCEAYGLEAARRYQARVVNLPCSTGLTDDAIDRVCGVILAAL